MTVAIYLMLQDAVFVVPTDSKVFLEKKMDMPLTQFAPMTSANM